MVYYASIIYDGGREFARPLNSVATHETDVYATLESYGSLVKINASGVATVVMPGYEMRGIAIADGKIFVANYVTGDIVVHDLSNFSNTIMTIQTGLTHLVGLCTDWDGQSGSTFYLYASSEQSANIFYVQMSGGNLPIGGGTMNTALGGAYLNLDSRAHLAIRRVASKKYLYITTMNYFIVQVDVTDVASPVLTALDSGPHFNQTYGITAHPTLDEFIIADFFTTGSVWRAAYTVGTDGEVSAFSTVSHLVNGGHTTMGSGDSTQSYVNAGNIGFNVRFNQVNFYIATGDGYIVKLYPSGGDPVGGGPEMCFARGTRVLCVSDGKDMRIHVEDLRRGMLVKTYPHGLGVAVKFIGKKIMRNVPGTFSRCMYKHKDGQIMVTGGHGILVDKITEKENTRLQTLGIRHREKINDKWVLVVAASDDFAPVEDSDVYEYYHFVLENDGDDTKRYGIWAEDVLTETPCEEFYRKFGNMAPIL